MHATPGEVLRASAAERTLRLVGAPNALAARMIQQTGFDGIYVSGAALSAGVLGLPDIGLLTLPELVRQTGYITRTAALPVVVDADTGFGEAVNVERTVAELIWEGAAAIQLEDQQLPKRCGHLSGKTLVEPEEMCVKLRAAVAVRGDDDLVLIARTDARGVDGFDAAVDRALRYLEAGADWIFPEALADRDEFERFAQLVDAPLVANMTEFGKSPLLPYEELAAMNYAAVLYPVTLLRIGMRAMQVALNVILDDGHQSELLDLMQTRQELYDLLGYHDYEQRDREYFGGEAPTKTETEDHQT